MLVPTEGRINFAHSPLFSSSVHHSISNFEFDRAVTSEWYVRLSAKQSDRYSVPRSPMNIASYTLPDIQSRNCPICKFSYSFSMKPQTTIWFQKHTFMGGTMLGFSLLATTWMANLEQEKRCIQRGSTKFHVNVCQWSFDLCSSHMFNISPSLPSKVVI